MLVITSLWAGYQWGSIQFQKQLRQLPPNHELGQSFKIDATVGNYRFTKHGIAISLKDIRILSPQNCTFRLPNMTAYLPPDAKPLKQRSTLRAWVTLTKRTQPQTFSWPMLSLWETYRPSYACNIKSLALIEVATLAAARKPSKLTPANQQLLDLFLRGKKSWLWSERLQPFGLGHLLSISGMHCLLVLFLLKTILFFLRRPLLRTFLTCLGLIAFAHHMGWSASVTRATLMLVLWMVMPVLNLGRNSFKCWAWLLFLGAVANPLNLLSQGFWYTFAASLGLLLGYRKLAPSPLIHPLHFRLHKLSPLLGAQCMVLPVSLLFGIHMPFAGFFWNLFGGVFLLILVILFVTALVAETTGFFFEVANGMEILIGKSLEYLQTALPTFELLRFPHLPLAVYFCLLLMGLILKFGPRETRWYLCIATISLFLQTHKPISGEKTIMLDVGQGLCMLHVDAKQQGWLFDAGGRLPRGINFQRVVRLFGAKQIAAVFISHDNLDHFGLIRDLKDPFPVYLPKEQFNQLRARPFLRNHRTQLALLKGHHLQAGQLHLEVLLPDPWFSAPNSNEGSLVMLAKGSWGEVLITGDAGIWAESRMAFRPSEKTRWLQVGHHGSKTATGSTLLSKFQPDIALISAGRRNAFNHPHPHVLERLYQQGADVQITSTSGTLILHLNQKHESNFIQPSPSAFQIRDLIE